MLLLLQLAEENPEIFEIYQNTELKCRKVTKIMVAYLGSHEFMFMVAFIKSIYSICIGDFDTLTWPLPFAMCTPIDTKMIFGWYIFWAFQVGASMSYALAMISTTSYFVCCCYYIEAICKHLNLLINSIRDCVERNKSVKNAQKYEKNVRIIKQQLHGVIEIHVKLLE